MKETIGLLKKGHVKSVWPNEEHDFTPWLERQGLSLLLEKLGIDEIKETQREVRCGDGKKSEADLIVTYPDGDEQKTLVIENQYGKSDADHLGRLLMYSANTNASVVVWITEEEKQEYVATINWLNDNCASDLRFYLVRISVYTIGDSLPAPMFEILAQPKDEALKISTDRERSEAMDLCFGFWQSCLEDKEFLETLANAGMRQRKANSDRWKDYSIGSSDVWLSASITTKEGRVKVNIACKNDSMIQTRMFSRDFMDDLASHMEMAPVKGQTETKSISTLNFYRDIDVSNGAEQQAAARKWFGEMLPKLKNYLKLRGIV